MMSPAGNDPPLVTSSFDIEVQETSLVTKDGHSITFPYPIVEAIHFDKNTVVRLEIPEGIRFNRNVVSVTTDSVGVSWIAPSPDSNDQNSVRIETFETPDKRRRLGTPIRHHSIVHDRDLQPGFAATRAHYVKIARKYDAVALFDQRGEVTEVTPVGWHVINQYRAGDPPRFEVCGAEMKFRGGGRVHFPQSVIETLSFDNAVAVLLDFGRSPENNNLFGVNFDGAIAWQVDWKQFNVQGCPCTGLKRHGMVLRAYNLCDWAFDLNPASGEILQRTYLR